LLLHFLHARDIAQPANRVRTATRDDVALAIERGDFLRNLDIAAPISEPPGTTVMASTPINSNMK
jgi:hypothetical protein